MQLELISNLKCISIFATCMEKSLKILSVNSVNKRSLSKQFPATIFHSIAAGLKELHPRHHVSAVRVRFRNSLWGFNYTSSLQALNT